MKKILFTLLAVLAFTGCNAQNTNILLSCRRELLGGKHPSGQHQDRGGPIWWGAYPQVMFTFFDTYDLNGKTIYPFTTHEGSGLGNVMSDIRKAYPNADVKPGFSIYGHEVRTNKAKVEKWIKVLGL